MLAKRSGLDRVARLVAAALGVAALAGCERGATHENANAAAVRARQVGTAAAYVEALKSATSESAWPLELELAQEARERFPQPDAQMAVWTAAGFWCGGRLHDATDGLDLGHRAELDADARNVLLWLACATGDMQTTRELADGLQPEELWPTAFAPLLAVQVLNPDGRDRTAVLRKAYDGLIARGFKTQVASVEPAVRLAEAGGQEPLYEITRYGAAGLPLVTSARLAGCDAELNGHGPYRLILDSGAGATIVIAQRVADELKLVPICRSTVGGFGGTSALEFALADRVQVGEIECRRVLVAVAPDDTPFLLLAEGILGAGIFLRGRVELDFKGPGLRVQPSGTGEDDEGLPIWMAGLGYLLAEGRIDDEPISMLLDTGATFDVVSTRWLHHIDPNRTIQKSPLPVLGMGAATQRQTAAFVGTLEFAGRRMEHRAALASDELDRQFGALLGMQIDLILGMDTFVEMERVVIDFPARRMWVKWLAE